VQGGELNSYASKELGETNRSFNQRVHLILLQKQDLKRDVIIKLDNQNIATYADLSGYINTKRPNDKVEVTILREAVKHSRI
jgi:S1-C subfamily serine protease